MAGRQSDQVGKIATQPSLAGVGAGAEHGKKGFTNVVASRQPNSDQFHIGKVVNLLNNKHTIYT